jgi:hypothetical protein
MGIEGRGRAGEVSPGVSLELATQHPDWEATGHDGRE